MIDKELLSDLKAIRDTYDTLNIELALANRFAMKSIEDLLLKDGGISAIEFARAIQHKNNALKSLLVCIDEMTKEISASVKKKELAQEKFQETA